MADLTFQQLSDAIGGSSPAISVTGGVVSLNLSALTDGATTLAATGVVEALFKLLKFANAAQTTLNTGNTVVGTRLSAFGLPAYQAPVINSDGSITSTASITLQAKSIVDNAGIVGTSA
jgi:hypothetical protein